MSPELDDVLRTLKHRLEEELLSRMGGTVVTTATRDAIQAMINAIAATLMEHREPK